MPAIETVHIDDLRGYIAQTLRAVNDGVWDVRQGGAALNAEIPQSIDFKVNVLFEWQPSALELRTSQVNETSENGKTIEINGGGTRTTATEKQTGETKDTSNSEDDSQKSQTSAKTSNNTNVHTQSDAENITGKSS